MPVNQLESWISLQIGLPRKTILSRGVLRRWQRERLLQTIALARENSPWYRQRLRNVSLPDNADIEQILRALPLLTSDDLRDHDQEMLCSSQAEIQRVITLQSSGTTASPKRLFFTAKDLRHTTGFFQHGMRLVAAPQDCVLVMLPSTKDYDVGSLLVNALHQAGFSAHVQWPAHEPQIVAQAVRTIQANCLIGLPHHILSLARDTALAQDISRYVRRVLLCSDYTAPVVRQAIAHKLECRVHEHYGSTESGLGGAVECSAGTGCHIRENDLLFEVVDPSTGEQLPDRAEGELVFSTITRSGMPLLRYRTGDRGSITHSRCSCGSVLARLQNLNGRLKDMAWLPTGEQLTMAELDQALLSSPWITGYEAVLDDEPNAGDAQSPPNSTPKTVLRLRIKALTSKASWKQEKVKADLLGIPAIHRAITYGSMRIAVTDHHDPLFPSHTVKRHLQDNRNQPLG